MKNTTTDGISLFTKEEEETARVPNTATIMPPTTTTSTSTSTITAAASKTNTPKINSSTKYISDWYAQYWSTTGKKLNRDFEKVLLPSSHVNTRMISSEKESFSQYLPNNHMKPKTVARIRDDFLTGVSDSKIPPIKYFSRLIIPLLSK